ncbi:hypothetical protein MKW98_011283 [Papaver atlanticum]|uniref:Uncharacterized protein n=1 Tax=Papaver atlanticum TaxID=357466 RepID=A0AAD4XL93_9MAGN|nr:hypothetical protein MKW98_011283 [Papaver atlanticum]
MGIVVMKLIAESGRFLVRRRLFPESSDPQIEATGVSSWTGMHEGSSVGFKRRREDVSRSVVILSIRFLFQKLIPNWSPLRTEDTWDGWNEESNPVKEFEKYLSSIIRKDTPREEMAIEEDNHTADWATRMEEPRFVRVYRRGHSGVEAAEAATDFIKKVKIEEDTEVGSFGKCTS